MEPAGRHPKDDGADNQGTRQQSAMPTRQEFQQLVRKMNEGDQSALLAVRDMLDNNPEIWRQAGDLGRLSEFTLIQRIAEKNKLAVGMFSRYIESLKEEIAGYAPTPLERLVAQRVVQCWLQVQHVDIAAADTDMPLPQARFWASRQGQAHRRFISAVKSLTMIRALLPPAAPRAAIAASADSDSRSPACDKPEQPKPTSGNGKAAPSHEVHRGNGKAINRVFPVLEPAGAP